MRSSQSRGQGTPGSYILCGIVVAILAAVLAAPDSVESPTRLLIIMIGGAIAQALILIGCIAKGIQVAKGNS